MIVLDANLLLNAVNRHAERHRESRLWIEKTISGTETVAIPWLVLLAFIRVSTRLALFKEPLTVRQALELVDDWLNNESVVMIEPGPRHYQILKDLLRKLGTAGNLTQDAHLAAIAIEHGARLYSFDRDFSRFPGLDWREPV